MSKALNVLILVETSREYGRGLLRGIARYANTYGSWNIYREPEFYLKSSKDQKASKLLDQRDYDGIIMREQPEMKDVLKLDIPTVIATYLDEKHPNVSFIDVDYNKIGEIAAEHFLERGFKNFGYCGFDFMYWSRRRGKSFEHFVNKAEHTVHFYKSSHKKIVDWNDEKFVISKWLEKLPKPVAIFTCNDDRGEQVLDACKIANIRVPDEVAVLGIDNDEFVCNLSTPPLSSVGLNTERAGFEAAKTLNSLMTNKSESKPEIIMTSPAHVITRQSTDILAIDDSEVAKAIHFIRKNANRYIQVSDVVNETSLSRCGLYLRFQKAIGCSVHEEIKRVRIEKIANMLIDTDLSVSQIALQLGFADANHIARYFKKVISVTPLAYRRKYNFRQ